MKSKCTCARRKRDISVRASSCERPTESFGGRRFILSLGTTRPRACVARACSVWLAAPRTQHVRDGDKLRAW
eukprot:4313255-Pleurochrysis_carterae.AAC.1